jgi:hypothetical protein
LFLNIWYHFKHAHAILTPFSQKLALIKKSLTLLFLWWPEDQDWSVGLFAILGGPGFTTKS